MVSTNSISSPALIADFPWGTYHDKTVADIGGGTGSFLATLLTAQPNLNGILFDLPAVIAHAEAVWHDRYPALLPRVKFVAGSFFESVPPAEVYFMRHIIHDWNDELSIKVHFIIINKGG